MSAAPHGFYVDAQGYSDLAALARAKAAVNPAWAGLERYLTRRSHDAAVEAERQRHAARTIIEQARADALEAYRAMCRELDEPVTVTFVPMTPAREAA